MGGTLSIGPGVGTGVRVHAEWTQNFLES
jgi:hypothetical protein